ncbi:MAG TPA: YraN family protein [Stellaceae bacterium]|nr:YraN family protein [Stellaceae bacterium]
MKRLADPRRLRARRRGRFAEQLCRWHLRLRGWRILASDWRCPAGEIDILARRGDVLAAIEVKSRPDFASGAAALQPRQRRRIARAAEAFLAMRPELAALAVRFDVMIVAPLHLPRHLPGAWRSDG